MHHGEPVKQRTWDEEDSNQKIHTRNRSESYNRIEKKFEKIKKLEELEKVNNNNSNI